MIPLGNTARIEGAATNQNGAAGRIHGRKIRFPISQRPSKSKPKRTCPECGAHNIRRSRRRLWEKTTNWLHPDQRMFRCYRCQHRFWDTHDEGHTPSYPDQTSSFAETPDQSYPAHNRSIEVDPKIPLLRRIDYWLYRKHSLTLGTAIFLILVGGLLFAGLFWGFSQFAS